MSLTYRLVNAYIERIEPVIKCFIKNPLEIVKFNDSNEYKNKVKNLIISKNISRLLNSENSKYYLSRTGACIVYNDSM